MYYAGIIGCGRIACELPDNHAKSYRDNPDIVLRGVCDANFFKAMDCSEKWEDKNGQPYWCYQDYIKMVMRGKIDIISVCTPPETHCQIVCDIAPFVKAIYCEKPIALTLEDADKMIEACHEHNVILQINHQRRFTRPKFRFARGVLNTGTHVFDLINYLFKVPVDIEYIDSDEYIFELDCTHNGEKMIPLGVAHLVECLKENKQSISSGEAGREALRMCLEYERNRRHS